MMAEPSDPITWQTIAAGAATIISGLVGYIVRGHDKKIDAMDSEVTKAASAQAIALENHRKEDRETFKELFEGQAVINENISQGFIDLNKTISGMHVSLLGEIAKKADK